MQSLKQKYKSDSEKAWILHIKSSIGFLISLCKKIGFAFIIGKIFQYILVIVHILSRAFLYAMAETHDVTSVDATNKENVENFSAPTANPLRTSYGRQNFASGRGKRPIQNTHNRTFYRRRRGSATHSVTSAKSETSENSQV